MCPASKAQAVATASPATAAPRGGRAAASDASSTQGRKEMTAAPGYPPDKTMVPVSGNAQAPRDPPAT